jgi:hypothetical protein
MGALDIFRGGSSDVEGYTPETGLGSDITAGGRRRRKSLRRKGARKGTRKRARKHSGGYSQKKQQQGGIDGNDGNDENDARRKELQAKESAGTITEDERTELEKLMTPVGKGGSRRRKSRHSKKSHSKKTRGKKTSAWIKHVLQFAKDNKMKYFQALKDKRCRATYKSSK